ncbi:cytochrome P450, partial [Amylostereum chailletii]
MFTFILGSLAAVIAYCAYKHVAALQAVNNLPGLRPLVSPLSLSSTLFSRIPFVLGTTWNWTHRHTAYFYHTHDIISIVPLLPYKPLHYTSSLAVMKQILGSESRVHTIKPYDLTLKRLLGENILSSSGELWKRYRRAVAPAFTTKTFESGWGVSKASYRQMTEGEKWDGKAEIIIDNIHPLMLKLTLMVISKAGFGFGTSWHNSGDHYEFSEAFRVVASTLVPRIVTPFWAYSLPIERLQKMGKSWSVVSSHVATAFGAARSSQVEDGGSAASSLDLLDRLVSSALSLGKFSMSEEEVIANMFTLLFAGHETTASGLVTTLAYLSVYQDEQEKAYQEIERAWMTQDADVRVDETELGHTLRCFYEAQRLCPTAYIIPREMTEDVPIAVMHPEPATIVLNKGSV